MPRQLKIAVIFLTAAIGVLLLAVVAYVLYVYLQYYRIDDGQILTVSSEKTDTIRTGKTYSVMTYNIGFGASGPDFSFFMDSGVMDTGEKKTGRYGKAIDRQSVTDNIAGSVAAVRAADCDFVLLQEVDSDGSRSYHVDQVAAFTQNPAYASVYAVNFHTAYLFWPLNDPHGKNESGVLTLTKYAVSSAVRRSYPVSTSFDKFFDLDRCFSVTYLPVSDSDRQLGARQFACVGVRRGRNDPGAAARHAQHLHGGGAGEGQLRHSGRGLQSRYRFVRRTVPVAPAAPRLGVFAHRCGSARRVPFCCRGECADLPRRRNSV